MTEEMTEAEIDAAAVAGYPKISEAGPEGDWQRALFVIRQLHGPFYDVELAFARAWSDSFNCKFESDGSPEEIVFTKDGVEYGFIAMHGWDDCEHTVRTLLHAAIADTTSHVLVASLDAVGVYTHISADEQLRAALNRMRQLVEIIYERATTHLPEDREAIAVALREARSIRGPRCQDHYHCRNGRGGELAASGCDKHRMACAKSGEITSVGSCPRCSESWIEGGS